MIKSLSFKNFKAFENGKINIKPITILLGANNVGKSSIIQLLLMLEQTANIDKYKSYSSALKLNGDYVKLGEIENIFRNLNTKHELEFSIQIGADFFTPVIKETQTNLRDLFLSKYIELNKLFSVYTQTIFNEELMIKNIRKNPVEYFEFLRKDLVSLKKKIKTTSIQYDILQRYFPAIKKEEISTLIKEIIGYNYNEFLDAFSILQNLEQIEVNELSIVFGLKYHRKTNAIKIERFAVKNEDADIIKYYYKTKHLVESGYIEKEVLNRYRVKFGKEIRLGTLFSPPFFSEQKIFMGFLRSKIFLRFIESPVIAVLGMFVNSSFSELQKQFDNRYINYVNPLRAFPKRYYFLDKSNINHSLNTIDGDNLTEILKEDKPTREKVNKWLSKFDLKLAVNELQDIIHKINIHQFGLHLDITDVGFGISQVLPIIVQSFMSNEKSLTIIEQPEIHLHPKMQAELADLFVDVIYSNDGNPTKSLLIETHSEYILKRLRRRIAEGKLKSSDIGIYFIHPRSNEKSAALIEEIKISEKGSFNWPAEFYSEDLNDTMEFLKHQIS